MRYWPVSRLIAAGKWLRAEQVRTRHERERFGPEGEKARQALADRFAEKLRPTEHEQGHRAP